jgi:hypothetical protein
MWYDELSKRLICKTITTNTKILTGWQGFRLDKDILHHLWECQVVQSYSKSLNCVLATYNHKTPEVLF